VNPETDRLVAEPISDAHQKDMERLLGDPRVGATMGGVLTPPRVAALTARLADQFERHGYGFWVWREKASREIVARGGIQHTHVGGRDEVEVGWAVMPHRWGEGFATELGDASLRAGFDEHGLDTIVAFTLPRNRASQRVMEKLGMTYERDIVHADMPHVLYRIARFT
jgi:ribosomal-protein-alanine N-acetyltransferase